MYRFMFLSEEWYAHLVPELESEEELDVILDIIEAGDIVCYASSIKQFAEVMQIGINLIEEV